MTIQQISVFLENRAGELANIVELLAENQIDLLALNIAEAADYGVLRLIADAPHKAAELLKEKGFIVKLTPVVQVPVPHCPGGLNEVLRKIASAEIDIEYMYSVLNQRNGLAYMIFRVADPDCLDAALKD